MIMDLSKMREFGWIPRMLNVFKKYRQILVLADQDIMRLTFFFHPGKKQCRVLTYSCSALQTSESLSSIDSNKIHRI